MDGKEIVLYAALALVLAVLAFGVYTLTQQPQGKALNAAQAFSDELADICATPEGYTDASWREHMSHHPDRYAKCLRK
jgi:hypothetical protein